MWKNYSLLTMEHKKPARGSTKLFIAVWTENDNFHDSGMKYGEKVDVTDCQRFENVTDVTRQNKCMYAADTVHSMISLS